MKGGAPSETKLFRRGFGGKSIGTLNLNYYFSMLNFITIRDYGNFKTN